MIPLSLTLLVLALSDLLQGSAHDVSRRRTTAAVFSSGLTTAAAALVIGLPAWAVAVTAVAALAVSGAWIIPASDSQRIKARHRLVGALALVAVAFAAAGAVDGADGLAVEWYGGLDTRFSRTVPVEQFLLGVSVVLFLLATGNRLVRLVLDVAGTPAAAGESALKGGRILGPIERLFVAGMVISGDLPGIAVLITAKGLLRLPEIRSSTQQGAGAGDDVTEYFLIGTLASLLLAVSSGLIVLASA